LAAHNGKLRHAIYEFNWKTIPGELTFAFPLRRLCPAQGPRIISHWQAK